MLANDYCPAFPPPCGLWPRPPPPLASLFGFRSRTSTCGLSFFSSLIVPFFSLLVVFLVLGCVSRAEIFAPAYDLLVWDQVVQTDQLIFRTLLPLSSTLPRICVLFFLRRTHIRLLPLFVPGGFSSQLFPQFAASNRYRMTCSAVSYIPNAINENSNCACYDGIRGSPETRLSGIVSMTVGSFMIQPAQMPAQGSA